MTLLPNEAICNDCYMKKKCKPSSKERAERFGCGLKNVIRDDES
jgi:hypothetical protein